MKLKQGHQIIKTRDDNSPVQIESEATPSPVGQSFRLSHGAECSWAKINDSIWPRTLRSRIEPLANCARPIRASFPADRFWPDTRCTRNRDGQEPGRNEAHHIWHIRHRNLG